MPLCNTERGLIRSYVSQLSGFNFNTDEIDAADMTSPDLPAKRWSHGYRVRNKCPHTDAEAHSFSRQWAVLAGCHSAELRGWSNSWLLGIKRKAYLLPLRV